jgi:dolichol-phosphate mannosyltransferase
VIGVVIPSYKEAENIAALVTAIRSAAPEAIVVIVDDSPDLATVDAVAPLRGPSVRVIHRGAKEGRGTAVLLGIRELLDAGCDPIVEMDADFSHAPAQIPELAAALQRFGADMVVGSRYVPGGRIVNWPLSRRIFSRAANALVRALFRVPMRDYTGGFRAYSRRAAELIVATCGKIGRGFIPLSEIAVTVHHHGMHVAEVPTTFVNRTRGKSSFGVAEVWEAARGIGRIYALKRRLGKEKGPRV